MVTENRRRRMFMQDFKLEEFEFKPFDFRFSLFSLLYPYETWEFFGRGGGFPAPMRKRNPFTPEWFYWISRWVIVLAVPVLLLFSYGLAESIIMNDGLAAVMKALGGVVFCAYGMWSAYNIRRGYRAGLEARLQERDAS